jgi:hypothetical protein
VEEAARSNSGKKLVGQDCSAARIYDCLFEDPHTSYGLFWALQIADASFSKEDLCPSGAVLGRIGTPALVQQLQAEPPLGGHSVQ